MCDIEVSRNKLWETFISKNRFFPLKYKVYSFFRNAGYSLFLIRKSFIETYSTHNRFVVKTGIHYGLDYAVYRLGPMLSHSEFCLLVIDSTGRKITGEDDVTSSSSSRSQLGWRHLSSLTRVMPVNLCVHQNCS